MEEKKKRRRERNKSKGSVPGRRRDKGGGCEGSLLPSFRRLISPQSSSKLSMPSILSRFLSTCFHPPPPLPPSPSPSPDPSSFSTMDTYYISHGSPMLPLDDCPARDFLTRWREFLPEKPKAVLAISAHWYTSEPEVSTTSTNSTIHDFYGFPPQLYKLRYNAPGAPQLAKRVKQLLHGAGFSSVREDSKRGLDHGAWVPLYLMYPDVDIPVCQLSVQPNKDGRHHYELGKALAPLRDEGILIMASGSATHNLRTLAFDNSSPPKYMSDFDNWLNDSLVNGRFDDVIEFEQKAPSARKVHPSTEHFLPLLVALGAAGGNAKARRIHSSWVASSLSMASFAFSP